MAKGFQKIIFGLMLGILITAFVNVGISLFMNEPMYNDYCNEFDSGATPGEGFKPAGYKDCNERYQEAYDKYSRNAFFILAIVGFGLLVGGLFISQFTLQVMLLSSGALNVIMGVVRNLKDKLLIFIALGFLIAIGIYIVMRMIEK